MPEPAGLAGLVEGGRVEVRRAALLQQRQAARDRGRVGERVAGERGGEGEPPFGPPGRGAERGPARRSWR